MNNKFLFGYNQITYAQDHTYSHLLLSSKVKCTDGYNDWTLEQYIGEKEKFHTYDREYLLPYKFIANTK